MNSPKSSMANEHIQLVGGPMCGSTVVWPDASDEAEITYYGGKYPYRLINTFDRDQKPVVRGWYSHYRQIN